MRRQHTARKTKTGCETCKIRHMKCDETKPSCKRCILAGRKCVGVYYSDQPVPIEPSRASTQTTMGDADKKRELQSGFNIRDVYNPTPDGIALQLVTKRLLPPDWHFLEVLSFYGQVAEQQKGNEPLVPVHFLGMTSDVPYERPRSTAITAGGFAERIQLLSRHHDTPLEPNAGVDTDVLWNRLYKTLNETIAEINSEIGIDSVGMIVRTLQNITNLTVIETALRLPSWTVHINGLLALLRVHGGPMKLYPRTDYIQLTIHVMTTWCITSNTLCSMDKQISGIHQFTTEEILYIYQFAISPYFNCPTVLFAEIWAITKLRHKISNQSIQHKTAVAVANQIKERISAFVPEQWTEMRYSLPDTPEVLLNARIFKLAVMLFALQATPGFYQNRRNIETTGQQLLKLLVDAYEIPKCFDGLDWPIAVMGCALSGGSLSDQKLLVKLMHHGDKNDLLRSQHIIVLEHLRKHWASGSRSWEDCWDEPFICFG